VVSSLSEFDKTIELVGVIMVWL